MCSSGECLGESLYDLSKQVMIVWGKFVGNVYLDWFAKTNKNTLGMKSLGEYLVTCKMKNVLRKLCSSGLFKLILGIFGSIK